MRGGGELSTAGKRLRLRAFHAPHGMLARNLTDINVPHSTVQVWLLRGGNGNVVVATKDQPIAQCLELGDHVLARGLRWRLHRERV